MLVSNCCNAKVVLVDYDKGIAICSDCKEWCEFVEEEESEFTLNKMD